MVGEDIVIRVIEVRGRGAKATVKLGIDAPSGTKILREEVLAEVAEEMTLAQASRFDLDELKASVKDRARPES